MQQSIRGQESPDEPFKNPHDLDFILNLTFETTEITGDRPIMKQSLKKYDLTKHFRMHMT